MKKTGKVNKIKKGKIMGWKRENESEEVIAKEREEGQTTTHDSCFVIRELPEQNNK